MTGDALFRLNRPTLSSFAWYLTVATGWPLIALACWHLVTTPTIHSAPQFGMIALLVALLELLPLVQGRGHDPQGVVMSTAFSMAILFMWGLWPALLAICVGSILFDVRAKKQWWKLAFNPAQYAVSLGAAYLVVAKAYPVSLAHPGQAFHQSDLWWMVGAWVVYYAVNLALVMAVLSYKAPFRDLVRHDFWHTAGMTFAVFALSPLVVIVSQRWWTLVPLLLVPLLLIYYTAQLSLEREHAAGHDILTGLPNRDTFSYRLGLALTAFAREGRPFALMLIDLDDFKAVNDALGHPAGDELLRHFAHRLAGTIRAGDAAARLGGDEFAVVLLDVDAAQAAAVAHRLHDDLSHTVMLDGMAVEVTLSVGVAACPQDAHDENGLLRLADVAMYRAKGDRSGVAMYQAEYEHDRPSRLGMVRELRQAIESDELELYYQPKLAADRVTIGVEALARWHNRDRGWVSPDEFIQVAEHSGLMPLLTAKVISIALAQVADWRAQGLDMPVAVNIAPTDLFSGDLPSLIAQELARYRVPAEMLQLEITERIATAHLEQTRQTLDALRTMGVTISLDDFGTGYSSLLRLGSLPVDEIKIDKVFVSRLPGDPRALDIIATLVGLAHALGVPAIAEGVETQEQLHLLEAIGCDGVQGWYIAHPMPSALTTEWIRGRMASSPLPAASLVDGTAPTAPLAAAQLVEASAYAVEAVEANAGLHVVDTVA